MTWKELGEILESDIEHQIRTEKRLKQLEAKQAEPTMKFAGTYKDTVSYQPGDCATRQGALWVCTATTTGAFDHKSWVLAVKKRDAR